MTQLEPDIEAALRKIVQDAIQRIVNEEVQSAKGRVQERVSSMAADIAARVSHQMNVAYGANQMSIIVNFQVPPHDTFFKK